MLLPKVFYGTFFGAAVFLFPYLAIYYQEIGLSGSQMGMLMGIPAVVSMFGSPLWGALADATRRHKLLLCLALCGMTLTILGISAVRSFTWLLPLVILYAFFTSPVMALADNSVMERLGPRKHEYGKVRMWGAVGWGLMAPIAGSVINRSGLIWGFYGFAIGLLINLVVVLLMSVVSSQLGKPFWLSLSSFSNRRWAQLLGLAFVGGLCMSILNNYLFLHLSGLGANETLMGFSLTLSTISEFIVFFFADRLIKRWKARPMLVTALFLFALRTLAYSFSVAPWQVLALQLLHGVTFSLMWSAGVAYVNEIAPPGLGATAQGLFSGVMYGLGGGSGSYIGGLLYDSAGTVGMFRFTGLVSLLVLVLLLIVVRRREFIGVTQA